MRRRAPFRPQILLLAGLPPFLHKPYHIDEPVFPALADQIRRAPTRPYDLVINWTHREAPVDLEWWAHRWMLPFPLIGS